MCLMCILEKEKQVGDKNEVDKAMVLKAKEQVPQRQKKNKNLIFFSSTSTIDTNDNHKHLAI